MKWWNQSFRSLHGPGGFHDLTNRILEGFKFGEADCKLLLRIKFIFCSDFWKWLSKPKSFFYFYYQLKLFSFYPVLSEIGAEYDYLAIAFCRFQNQLLISVSRFNFFLRRKNKDVFCVCIFSVFLRFYILKKDEENDKKIFHSFLLSRSNWLSKTRSR